MKKMLVLLALVLTMFAPAMADSDRVITFEQLPAQVQTLAAIVKIDRDCRGTYDVKLNNGMELEFNSYFQVIDIDD